MFTNKYLHTHTHTNHSQTGDVPPLRNDPRQPPQFPNPVTENTCKQLLQPDPNKNSNDLIQINGIPFYET
jgi:hypothetical protein